jgi:hypothetical protein
LIKVRLSKEKPVDLGAIVKLLEKDVGFGPISEVSLELPGRLVRRGKDLVLEAAGTGQAFAVKKIEANGAAPPENRPLTAIATLADTRSGGRVVLKQWKASEEPEPRP